MNRLVGTAVLVLVGLLVGLTIWQHATGGAWAERAGALESELEEVEEELERQRARADSARARSDSTEALLVAERARTAELVRQATAEIREQADVAAAAGADLRGTIKQMDPPELRDVALEQLDTHEEADARQAHAWGRQQRATMALLENTQAALEETQAALGVRSRECETCAEALQISEERGDAWEAAANPGFLDQVWNNLPVAGTFLGAGIVIGVFAGG